MITEGKNETFNDSNNRNVNDISIIIIMILMVDNDVSDKK